MCDTRFREYPIFADSPEFRCFSAAAGEFLGGESEVFGDSVRAPLLVGRRRELVHRWSHSVIFFRQLTLAGFLFGYSAAFRETKPGEHVAPLSLETRDEVR